MGGIVVTDKIINGNALPRLSGEYEDVCPGTPLAVIGLFVFALRARFTENAGEPLPWVWSDTLRPEDTEDGNPPPAGEPRKLLIDSAYNVKKNVRNYRPAIYVGRGGNNITPVKLAIDNKAGMYLPTSLKAYYCQAQMPLVIEIESADSGESSTIGDVVWSFILMTRDIFRCDFGLHEITEPILGDTLPSKMDKEIWTTAVSFSTTFDMRWGTVPIAPKLFEIAARVTTGYTSATEFYQSIAVRKTVDD